jgi:hypothetical protein
MGYLNYPLTVRDSPKRGLGRTGDRHLNDFAESIAVNVGGPYAERCSPAMNHRGVGAAIVLGVRESRIQGEGRQGIDVRRTINWGSPWESSVELDYSGRPDERRADDR